MIDSVNASESQASCLLNNVSDSLLSQIRSSKRHRHRQSIPDVISTSAAGKNVTHLLACCVSSIVCGGLSLASSLASLVLEQEDVDGVKAYTNRYLLLIK